MLTDHRGHSKENSLYALVAKLVQQEQCAQVYVCSRGNIANDAFFLRRESIQVYASQVDSEFNFEVNGTQFLDNQERVQLTDFDAILMRLPRPVSDEFLDFLSKEGSNQIIINDPQGIKKTSNKAFLLNFPDLCPSIKLCYSIQEIQDFAVQFPIVLKPLREYGGKGILKIEGNKLTAGTTVHNTLDYLHEIREYIETEGYLAMKFLKNVSEGDKRILVVDGQILAASLRLPAEGSWMCNVAQGGKSISAEVSPEEENIIKMISPRLKEEGVLIFGVDTLVDDNGNRILSEVNTLSIGGFPQAEQQTGRPILQQTIEKIINYVADQCAKRDTNYIKI